MIGLIKSIFGSKQGKEGVVVQVQPKPVTVQGSQAQATSGTFFLEPDAAKTLGDVDYMRAKKTVRRTFPKTASAPEVKEVTTTISFDVKEVGATGDQTTAPTITSASVSANVQEAIARRQADSGMDMFRNMAKQMRKN